MSESHSTMIDAQTEILSRPVVSRRFILRIVMYGSLLLLCIDMVYKTWNGITPLSRQWCIVYSSLPRWVFFLYEYFIELFLLVIAGIFAGALIERYLSGVKRFMPRSPFAAFVYASILPLCSCSVLPLITVMKNRMPLRSVITFVVAAPLLNPYIIMLSFTVLGLHYTVLRILCSMALAITTGYIVEWYCSRFGSPEFGAYEQCAPAGGCSLQKGDVFEASFGMLKKVMPFLLVAGLFGIGVEIFAPGKYLYHMNLNDKLLGLILVILIGIPVYFCNGADVLFLQPLVAFAGLPLGTAIAFSLTSTSVCVTSIVLLAKFLGKRLAAIVVGCIMVITFVLGCVIHVLPAAMKFISAGIG